MAGVRDSSGVSRLNRRIEGQGPDLVLLHGWGMSGGAWSGVVAELRQHFRIHCFDLPGHGASARLDSMSLDGVVDAISIAAPASVAVCGWSLGGLLALAWARRYPAQVRALVLIAATPCFVCRDDWRLGMGEDMFDSFAENFAARGTLQLQRFCSLMAQGDHDGRAVARWLRAQLSGQGEPDIAALSAALMLLRNADLRSQLPRVRQPVLLIHGELDQVTPLEAAEYCRSKLPLAQLELMPGRAHAPFVSEPRQVAHRMKAFFDAR